MVSCRSFVQSFSLSSEEAWLFYSPRGGLSMSLYAVYRFIVAAYFVTFYVWDLVFKAGRPTPQMAYQTMWAYLVQTVAMCVKLAVVLPKAIGTKCKRPDQTTKGVYPTKTNWILQFQWILHNIATTIPFPITIGYWINFARSIEYMKYRHATEPQFLQFTIQNHAITSVWALVDFALTAIPFRLGHVYQPLLFPVAYWVFGYLYYAVTGVDAIYEEPSVTDVAANFRQLVILELEMIASFTCVWLLHVIFTRYCCKPRSPLLVTYECDEKTPLIVP